MQIEPEAKVVQSHLGSQTSLKTGEVMRTLTSQAKGIQEFVVDRFDDLADVCQPSTQGFGPLEPLTALMRGSHHSDLILLLPLSMRSFSGKPFVSDIRALSGLSTALQTRGWSVSGCKHGLGQLLVMDTGRAKAKAGNHPHRSHTEQEMEAFVPPNAITPATIGLTWQPSCPTALGITSHGGCTIEHFIGTARILHALHQVQSKGRDRISMASHQSIELRSIRQVGKGWTQMMLRVAVKSSLTGKLHPLPKERQGDHLTALQRGHRSWYMLPLRQARLAKIIDHNVQCCQEGIQINHQLAPFLWKSFDMLTVRPGYLSFQLLPISHQTFKMVGKRGKVIFSDISQDLLDHCQSLARKQKVLQRCQFLQASAEDLHALADGSVTVVTTRSVLIYVKEKHQAFSEFYRVLQAHGRLAIFEPLNNFGYPQPAHLFWGYDVTPIQNIASKVQAVFDRLQPRETDPMLNFDERDMHTCAEKAGFKTISLTLQTHCLAQKNKLFWGSFLALQANPLVPTIGDAVQQVLTPSEVEKFTTHLRPLVESGQGSHRAAWMFLQAIKQ